jgi:Flp pilus assembly protein TadG
MSVSRVLRRIGAALRRRHRTLRGADRDAGYSALEAAITLPAIVFLLMAIVQWAIIWHARGVAQAAAQEGLRSAAAYGSTTAAGQQDVANYIRQVAPNALGNPHIDVTHSHNTITVHIHATVPSLVPFGSFTVDSTASGPVETWSPT